MQEYIVHLPLAVKPSKKWFYVNLNQYRNYHPFLLNKAKVMYKEVIQRQLQKLPVFSKVRLTYTYYPRDKRESDLGNVCSVHDKFFSDALVEAGKLHDDNHKYIPEINFRRGVIDKQHPRVEVLIEEIGKMQQQPETEQDQMQITLDEHEIHDAIRSYVRGQINIAEGQQIEIDMKAGRAENGFTATLNIRPATLVAQAQANKPVMRGFGKPNISTGEERVNVADADEDDIEEQLRQAQREDTSQLVSGGAEALVEVEEEVLPMTSTKPTGSNPFAGADDQDQVDETPVQEPEAETPVPVKKTGSIFGFNKSAAS